jgi:hypothetical protein
MQNKPEISIDRLNKILSKYEIDSVIKRNIINEILDITINIELSYEQRVGWFITNYYETGMEYESLLISMKDEDLDNIAWYGDTIKIPKYFDELNK